MGEETPDVEYSTTLSPHGDIQVKPAPAEAEVSSAEAIAKRKAPGINETFDEVPAVPVKEFG